MTHTPRNWKAVPPDVKRYGGDTLTWHVVDESDFPVDMNEANAHLIAAAPKLLKALNDIFENSKEGHAMATAHRAIAEITS